MMTVQEKVLKYLQEHKLPVQAAKIAKHYIISESAVNAVFRELMAEEKLVLYKQGNKKFYRLK
jgi:DNA-binding IscR family transcriptional regulator